MVHLDSECRWTRTVWCARHCAVECLSTWLMTSISSPKATDDPFGLTLCAVPRTHNSFGDRSFGAVGPRIWNSLPRGLRTPDISYKHFKALLKTYICFDKATALCDILHKRLGNILTYTYSLAPASWDKHAVSVERCRVRR